MCVERAFGILKGRWQILLRHLEMCLDNVAEIVGAYVCLHNLCVQQKEFGDESMLVEAKSWLLDANIHNFGDLQRARTMCILDYAKDELSRAKTNVNYLIQSIPT